MKHLSYVVIICGLWSCSHRSDKISETHIRSDHTGKEASIEQRSAKNNSNNELEIDTINVLKKKFVYHLFSDTESQDTFDITLYGRNTIKGFVVFKVINSERKIIFKKEFASTDLLGDMEDVLNKQQQADTINYRIEHFFDKTNFVSPAITDAETIEENLDMATKSERSDWNDVKLDKTSVGFFFSHGYESTFGLAYDKRKRKVVNIFYSD